MKSTLKPRIRRYYTTIFHAPDIVELRYGVWNPLSVNLKDGKKRGLLSPIIALLDGTKTINEIAKHAGCSLSDIYGVIEQLQVVNAIENDAETALDAYLDQLIPAFQGRSNPAQQPVLVLGDEWFVQLLTDLMKPVLPDTRFSGLPPDIAELWEATRAHAIHDDLKDSQLYRFFDHHVNEFVIFGSQHVDPIKSLVLNRVLVGQRIPHLYVCMDGPFVFVGPTVIPGHTACFECLEKRVQMNLREHASYVAYKDALVAGSVTPGNPAFLQPVRTLMASHAALEAINFLSTGSTFTRNKVLSVYLPTMEIVFNEFLRMPDCGTCAPSTSMEHTELHFDLY